MADSNQTYTYRAGKKVALNKSPDEFVVRTVPEQLNDLGIDQTEQVSPASTRVRTNSTELEAQMARARTVAPTHHAYYRADSGAEFLITDRVVVTFKDGVTEAQIDDLAARYGLLKQSTLAPRVIMFQVTDHTKMNPVKMVVKLTEDESAIVQIAEHDLNHRVMRQQFTLPTDPMYNSQWHLHTRYTGSSFDARCSTRCEDAWTALNGFGSADVVIGVTDDGCRIDHPDFDSPNKFASWGYFQGQRLVKKGDVDAIPGGMYQAGSNHGTSCAGVIAGEADAVLTVGAAPGCRLLPIKWESSGPYLSISDTKLHTAINYLADKVDIVSSSWGVVPTSVWSQFVVDRINALVQTGGRRGKGILFLWAAGNENCPIEHQANQDIPYTNGWEPGPNGSPIWVGVETSQVFENNLVGIPGVMHIAALASVAKRSHYSNYGTGIMICAPTSNSHKYWRMTVPGLGIVTTTGEASGVTQSFGGTSSATPLVAGVAALVISANPDLTALEVESTLKRTASKDLAMDGYAKTSPAAYDPNPVWDISPVVPFDVGDFQNNQDPDGTWSPWFGYGRIDAHAAVAEALRTHAPTPTRTLKKNAKPAMAIPDNIAPGISSTISFDENAVIADVSVRVDISHTYIGDLFVKLMAPSGTVIELHKRTGRRTQDLKRAYTLTDTEVNLGTLIGHTMRGIWTLSVEDRAAQDVGTLNEWELAFGIRETSTLELGESPGIDIPGANSTGIERVRECGTEGKIKDIRVHVDITHGYIGDLRVNLVSPQGTVIPLQDGARSGTDSLIADFTTADIAKLGDLHGQSCKGAWRLCVFDTNNRDVGKLNQWTVYLASTKSDTD